MIPHLLDKLLLGTVADHSLHLVSRQLRAQHRLNAHGGMWTVDNEITASIKFRAQHRLIVLGLHRYRAPKAADGLRLTWNVEFRS